MKNVLVGIFALFLSVSALGSERNIMPSTNIGGIYYSDECDTPIALYLTNGVYEVSIPLAHFISYPDTRKELKDGIEKLRDDGQIINIVVKGGLCT